MLRGIINSPRTRMVALAVGLGVAGSLATAGPSAAVTLPAGLPLAGSPCAANATSGAATTTEGKISGRGSSLQTWLQFTYINDYGADVCGSVPSDAATNSYTPPTSANCPGNPATILEPAGDPSDPTSPIDQCTPNPTAPGYNADGMVAYNYPSAQDVSGTGSTQGKISISCRDDAFSGTDLPYATTDMANMDSTEGAEATLLGKTCTPTGDGTSFVSPYQTVQGASDPAGKVMSFPIGVSAVALAVNLPSTCYTTVGAGLGLTTADVGNLFGGNYTNWNQVVGATNLNTTACNLAVTRVVRNDTSGTTQGFLNYLADANGSSFNTCSTTEAVGSTTIQTGTFPQLDLNANGDQGYSPENNIWPGNTAKTGCSAVTNSGKSGGQTLLHLLTGTSGGIGYADVSDVIHDPGDAASLVIPSVQSSAGAEVLPYTGTAGAVAGAASNCTFGGSTPALPASPVGLSATPDWALDAVSATSTNPADDVSYNAQGSGYPICSLTWDFVFSGEDGNNKTTASGTQTLPTGTLVLSSIPAGTPTSGTAEIKTPNQIVSYNGITGNTLDNVQFGFGKVLSGQQVLLPNGTGGPEPELNADQRKSLYSYFSYVMSDAAQSTAAQAGYAQLPETWLSTLRGAFQAAF